MFEPPHDRRAPRLFDALPAMRDAIPWRPLCHVPTPVERITALPFARDHGRVWAKRDDRISPVYGGNKVRRFEFLFADFEARGARRIVTAGGAASTQVTATARFGEALGIPVTAVLFDQPATHFLHEALLSNAAAGAELIDGGGYARTVWRTWRALARDPQSALLMPGASGPRANLGYLDAMLELDAQVRDGAMPRPDVIVVPAGSSGTLAALSLGAAWLGWSTEIVGVRITALAACNRVSVGLVQRATQRLLARFDRHATLLRPRFTLFHKAIGPGYGAPTPEAIAGIEQVRTLTGLPGEVTYSGKALAALRALCEDPARRSQTLLFWHTLSSVRPAPSADARDRVPVALRRWFDAPLVA